MMDFTLRNQHRASALRLFAELLEEERGGDARALQASLSAEAGELCATIAERSVEPAAASALAAEGLERLVDRVDLEHRLHGALVGSRRPTRTWAALSTDAANGIEDPAAYLQIEVAAWELRLPRWVKVYDLPPPRHGKMTMLPRGRLAALAGLSAADRLAAAAVERLKAVISRVDELEEASLAPFADVAAVVRTFAACRTSAQLVDAFPGAAAIFAATAAQPAPRTPPVLMTLGAARRQGERA